MLRSLLNTTSSLAARCQEHGFWIASFDQFANCFSLNFSISNFVVFKLTFIQFNSHTLLSFPSYLQTSREENVWLIYCMALIPIHRTKQNKDILKETLQSTQEERSQGVRDGHCQFEYPFSLSNFGQLN